MRDKLFSSEANYQNYRKEFEQFVDSQTKGIDDIDLWFSDTPGGISFREAAIYYALVRELEPDLVVETGVANGNSSVAILAALERNDHGTLHSIDLPYGESSLEDQLMGDTLGSLVPKEFHHRWDFRRGYSQKVLPQLFVELDRKIDIFIHDSEHSAPCMMFEYELAWTWLRPKGVLLSDDIHQNLAFKLFCENRADLWGPIEQNTGFAIKN